MFDLRAAGKGHVSCGSTCHRTAATAHNFPRDGRVREVALKNEPTNESETSNDERGERVRIVPRIGVAAVGETDGEQRDGDDEP